MLAKINYDDRQHAGYQEGRRLGPEALALWLAAFAEHAPRTRPLAVLDLGSGTGRFAPALAEAFGGPVCGVEPSARMRALAEAAPHPPAVSYREGCAERIPLPDASCDLVLMFLSFHHVEDRGRGAAEIARVLRPGGRVFIRSTFADRMPALEWHRYFQIGRAAARERV